MSNSIPLSQIEGSPSAKFTQFGVTHAGRIVSLVERQQTDPRGELMTFDDGTPRMLWVISVEEESGDVVALYAKGGRYKVVSGEGESMLAAIGTAVRAAGADGVDVGGWLSVTHTGLGEQRSASYNPPKLYKAEYRPPKAAGIPAEDLYS